MASDPHPLRPSRRSPGRPKLEDVGAIESRLLEVALGEFVRHGYGAASLSQIVKAAKVSKTTLYSRYASKAELFRAIVAQHIDSVGANTALRPSSGVPDLEAGLKAYANRMLERSLHGGFLEVNRLVYGESHRFPELAAAAEERTALGIAQIATFIEECLACQGETCNNSRAAAETFIMMLRGWYLNAMLTGRKVPVKARERWVDYAIGIFLSGRPGW